MTIAPPLPVTGVFIDFIRGQGWDDREEQGFALLEGPYIHEAPERAVIITGTGGPGYVTDEASADACSFQCRVRGPSDPPKVTEIAALELDRLVLAAQFPAKVDGVNIQKVSRMGGRPVPMPVNPQDLRIEFTVTYIAVMGV